MQCSDRIRWVMSDKSLTINEFSKEIGISKRTIESYLLLNRAPGPEFLTAIATQLSVSATWILTGSGSPYQENHTNVDRAAPDFIPIQRFDVSASAGHGSLVGVEEGTGHYAFNRKWIDRRGLKPENLSVISVRGDSMEPALHDQDLILIDRSQKRPRDGDIYVVRYSGDLFVKHVQVMPESRIELRSANPLYGPIAIDIPPDDTPDDTDLAFIGRVVCSMHEW